MRHAVSSLVWSLCVACGAISQPSAAHDVAITFDDLPLNGQLVAGSTELDVTKATIAVLKKYRVPPVYGFINARKLERNPSGAAALKLWVSAGQKVGNHGYSHLNLHSNAADAFIRDVEQNEPALQLLAKADEWRWFRYPYLREGDTLEKRREVRVALDTRKYRVAQVTLDYEDYLWNSPYARCVAKGDRRSIEYLRSSYLKTASEYLDANLLMAQQVAGRPINHVLLLHLGAFSATILPDLFDLMKKKGFRFVSLEEAQRDPIYSTDPDAASRYGGTLLEQWMDARQLPYPKLNGKPQKELDALCR